MKAPLFIRKWFNNVTKARFWFISADICPDFNTGQGETVSITIKAENEESAKVKAIEILSRDWDVEPENVYIFDIAETTNDELIYED